MPMYLGRDGQIYNRPVPGSVRIDAAPAAPPAHIPVCISPKPRRKRGSWLGRLFNK